VTREATLIPGDGIGRKSRLQPAGARRARRASSPGTSNTAAWRRSRKAAALPNATLDSIRRTSSRSRARSPRRRRRLPLGNVALRQEFDLYANVRHQTIVPGAATRSRPRLIRGEPKGCTSGSTTAFAWATAMPLGYSTVLAHAAAAFARHHRHRCTALGVATRKLWSIRRTAFGVLADDDEVDVLVAAPRHDRLGGPTLRRDQIPWRSATFHPSGSRRRRAGERALSASWVRRIESSVALGGACRLSRPPPCRRSCFVPGELHAERVEHLQGCSRDFRADAVAGISVASRVTAGPA